MRARTFRTRLWLRLAVLAAAAFWLAVLALVAAHPEATAPARAGALLFVGLFACSAALQGRTAVVVTPDGFVFRSLFRSVPVRAEEILGVRAVHGLGATLYAVLTRRGRFRFSSLVESHAELLELLVARARLGQRG